MLLPSPKGSNCWEGGSSACSGTANRTRLASTCDNNGILGAQIRSTLPDNDFPRWNSEPTFVGDGSIAGRAAETGTFGATAACEACLRGTPGACTPRFRVRTGIMLNMRYGRRRRWAILHAPFHELGDRSRAALSAVQADLHQSLLEILDRSIATVYSMVWRRGYFLGDLLVFVVAISSLVAFVRCRPLSPSLQVRCLR